MSERIVKCLTLNMKIHYYFIQLHCVPQTRRYIVFHTDVCVCVCLGVHVLSKNETDVCIFYQFHDYDR